MTKILWIIRFAVIQITYGRCFRIKGYIGSPNFLKGLKRAQIGNNVRIFPNARIEVGPKGRLVIENNVSIGPNVNITCFGTMRIGTGTTISANVFITDMDHDFSDPSASVMDAPNVIQFIDIKQNCFVGANSVVLSGTTLAEATVIGANSTVRGNIPKYSIVAGNPAKVIKKRV